MEKEEPYITDIWDKTSGEDVWVVIIPRRIGYVRFSERRPFATKQAAEAELKKVINLSSKYKKKRQLGEKKKIEELQQIYY